MIINFYCNKCGLCHHSTARTDVVKGGERFRLWGIAADSRQGVVLHLGFVCFLDSVIHFIFVNCEHLENGIFSVFN
jgi:hypothetical protein